jgi:hypothetical protein
MAKPWRIPPIVGKRKVCCPNKHRANQPFSKLARFLRNIRQARHRGGPRDFREDPMFKIDNAGRTLTALACTVLTSSVFMLGALGPAVGHIAAGTIA